MIRRPPRSTLFPYTTLFRSVFDSNAILLYLAEKTGRFLPANTPAARGELLSWLMFVATGVGPYSGQAVHLDRKSTRLNSSHDQISYAVFCLKKKKKNKISQW